MMNGMKRVGLAGLFAAPVAGFLFGGWATITVDSLPEYAVAGAPVEISYTVRQHGQQLLGKLSGSIAARSGEEVADATSAEKGNGKYVATVTVPNPGQWTVEINSGFLTSRVNLLPITVVPKGSPAPAPMSSANVGRHLFVAKGCVTCHSHQLTMGFNTLKVGPDLTEPKFMSAYLNRFLADPSIKTNWTNSNRMPDLALKPAEIKALVSFLNRETVASR